MPEAVIVSTARTPIGRAFRGAFNTTHGAVLGGHVVQHAVARAGIEPGEVDDVVLGCAMPERATGHNIARLSAIRAGLPTSVGGMTINRFCSSGLQTIAVAAQRIVAGEADVIVAGGLESISLVADGREHVREDWLMAHKPEVWMPMIQTADIVAQRYGVGRDAQDEYSLESQRRTAAAGQQAGRFMDEIAPLTSRKKVVDKNTKAESYEEVTLKSDEGNRPDTTLEGLAGLKPVREGGYITAGNASQLSDGASACLLMSAKLAEKRGLAAARHLPRLRGRGLRAGRDGDRAGVCGAEAAQAVRREGGRHRFVGTQRGVREPGAVLPRPARHSAGAAQCRRRLDLDRPSFRHERIAHDGPRADRRAPPRRQARDRDDVHRRRDGRSGVVRDQLGTAVMQHPRLLRRE